MNKQELWNRAVDRFWDNVDKDGPIKNPQLGQCWTWAGRTNKGYGMMSAMLKSVGAHRFAYQLLVGEIPDGMEIDHLCDNPSCVNPKHLQACSSYANIMRSNCIQAKNARKTHCKNGHPFDESNTWRGTISGFRRSCKTCNRLNMRKYRRRARGRSK